MFFLGSPLHWPVDVSRFHNFINWTMTYRLGWTVTFLIQTVGLCPKLYDKSFVPTIKDIALRGKV